MYSLPRLEIVNQLMSGNRLIAFARVPLPHFGLKLKLLVVTLLLVYANLHYLLLIAFISILPHSINRLATDFLEEHAAHPLHHSVLHSGSCFVPCECSDVGESLLLLRPQHHQADRLNKHNLPLGKLSPLSEHVPELARVIVIFILSDNRRNKASELTASFIEQTVLLTYLCIINSDLALMFL